jgi:hypothetical protein
MKEAIADVINYIDCLPDFDYDPGDVIMRIRGKLQTLLNSDKNPERSVATESDSSKWK